MSRLSLGVLLRDFIFSIQGSSLFAPFLFRGFLSLEPCGLPRLMRGPDSFALIICLPGTFIFQGSFSVGMCDLVTQFISVNASAS